MRSFAYGLALLGLLSSAACTSTSVNLVRSEPVAQAAPAEPAETDQSEIIADLLEAQVIYLGEVHTKMADHVGQLEIIEALHAEYPDLAIGFEMFQRPFQPVLDRYIAGEIDAETMLIESQYPQRWGFPWEFYAPIAEFAQDNQLPLLALNTPTEFTRQVAREGLESLPEGAFRYVPPLSEIKLEPEAYAERVRNVFEQAHQGHSQSMNFENFFAAQVLWDETMAEAIAEFAQANPETKVVVLTGQGHVIFGHGIPSRVARRLGPDLSHRTVILNPSPELQELGTTVSDQFWFSN